MEYYEYPSREEIQEIIKRPVFDTSDLDNKVKAILEDIKGNGDAAVKKYTTLFDKVEIDQLVVTTDEIEQAIEQVDKPLKEAIKKAIENIQKFHQSQVVQHEKVETSPGVSCWQKNMPIEKVGLYVPGGTAPLFSTVLMLGIPAKIAGCTEIVLCSPPSADGTLHPAILYAAREIGITSVFKMGGVQAIGAMAYGTESVPKTYKIFGPGNQYVTAAKQLVSRESVAIDMPAGPSEVAVMADETSDPAFVASDLLSQAEHGIDSQVILVTTSEKLIREVKEELRVQAEQLSRKDIIEQCLVNSKCVLVNNVDEMIDLVNDYAPEHLIISMIQYRDIADRIINAGSVFLGEYTPESAGDYASGTNHTLPTNGFARMYNGVNMDDYFKKITFQEITREGIREIGPAIELMAEAEQLSAHKNAVTLRMNKE